MPGSNTANSNTALSGTAAKAAGSGSAKRSILFERIIEHLLNDSSGAGLLERCIDPKDRESSKVPLRYRIIAFAFIEGYDLNQLNAKLQDFGCERLYARNLWEATLIYAFSKGLSFAAWKELEARCADRRNQISPHDSDLSDGKTTMEELRNYIEDNSEIHGGRRITRHVTRMMQEKIINSNEAEFQEWLNDNISSFSSAREKTRYYFCKYLLYYLETIVAQYIKAGQTGRELAEALDRASVFKITTELKRKGLSEAEIRDKFESAAISSKELFDSFNNFYFGYVLLDWMELQFEYYGDLESIPQDMKEKFASSARKYDRSLKGRSVDEIIDWAVRTIEDTEKKLDEIYSKDGSGKGYQKGRSGEKVVRSYIHGVLDLDRTNLICYLIFFGNNCELPQGQEITEKRLNDILRECGYTILDPSDEFDDFVIRFLNSDAPMETLIDEVNRFALDERNFYLYRLYRLSSNVDQTWSLLMS